MNVKMWLAGGAILGLAGVNGFLLLRNSRVEAEVARVRTSTEQEFSGIRQQTATAEAATRKTIEELNQALAESQAKATSLANQTGFVARKHAEKLVAGLAERQKSETAKQFEKVAEVRAEVEKQIGEVKQVTDTNTGKITDVATEVGVVKTEVATTKSTLDSTIADLKTVRGDLGIQSGLIATNGKELSALRELGERNYYEFTLTKSAREVKVAGVVLSLRKTDTKRNRFNLDVMADDKKVEKKDKTINEPVQFYVSRARQPYEIVINEIGKDKVVGYLATPKVLQARR